MLPCSRSSYEQVPPNHERRGAQGDPERAGFVTTLEATVAMLASIAGGATAAQKALALSLACHTRVMPDILVDFSPSRPDDDETAEVPAELVAAVRDLGYDAGP